MVDCKWRYDEEPSLPEGPPSKSRKKQKMLLGSPKHFEQFAIACCWPIAILTLRGAVDIDSHGCKMLAEEIGTGVSWLQINYRFKAAPCCTCP